MSQKTRRNLLIAILVLLLLLLAFLLWRFLRPTSEQAPAPAPAPAPTEQLPEETEGTASAREQQQQEERNGTASLQSASKTFAERYGSYSTEAEFANLRDVLPLMSASLAAQTQAFVDGATPAAEYYGVTTRVISLSVDSVDESAGVATVTITTQREEAKGSVQNISVRYQDLKLTFVKEGGAWKVSSANWQ